MRLHQVWEILAQAVDIPARPGSISSPSTYANPLKNGRGEKTRLGGNGDRGAAGDAKRTTHPRRMGMQDWNENYKAEAVLAIGRTSCRESACKYVTHVGCA